MKPKSKLFVDLDGVIVDWLGGSLELCGVNSHNPVIRNLLRDGTKIDDLIAGGRQTLTDAVNDAGPDFWLNLRFLPWGKELIARLKTEFAATHRLAFLTSPGKFPLAAQGKVAWLLNNYPDDSIIICRDKELCASEDAFLIDDADYQIKPFIRDGGCGFLWPNQYTLMDVDDRDLGHSRQVINQCVSAIKLVHDS